MNVGDGICDEKKHTCKATGQEPGAISQASIPELPYALLCDPDPYPDPDPNLTLQHSSYHGSKYSKSSMS